MDIFNNITRNQAHYDQIYSQVEIDDIVFKIKNLNKFLDDAIKTDTSWHGLYFGDFKSNLKGKKVLELGCGDGLNALIMDALGANVVAIDISDKSKMIIDSANAKLGTDVTAISGDFSTVEFESSSFDFIIGKAFLHHLTYDLEDEYIKKVSRLLKKTGEARFFEPATNSKLLDEIRWIIPVPGRPSKLNAEAFHRWKQHDPHPVRDNSTTHFVTIGKRYFNQIETQMIGSIERFHRIMPKGKFNRIYRRFSHRVEQHLPNRFRYWAARSQLIIYKDPK